VTAETASNDPDQSEAASEGSGLARVHVVAAAMLLIVGLALATLAALQLVLPELLPANALTTYGRIAPGARVLLDGWLVLGLLGAGYFAIGRITGHPLRHAALARGALVFVAVGSIVAAAAVVLGFGSGISGLDAPWWARAISLLGYLLAAVAVTGTSRTANDRLGAAGWYLTAAPIWLTLSAIVGLIPMMDGIAGNIQGAFADAGFTGLFVITASVGLLYFVLATISGVDPTEPRPLSALGFWSLTLVWANMGAVQLIYSPAPDWYETVTVAFAIASLIPLLTITGDLGLMIRGRVSVIADRASLRYAVVAGLALAGATIVNLLLAWRASSSVAQFSLLIQALDVLVVLGAGSFAIFAASSVMRGGAEGRWSAHLVITCLGLAATGAALTMGGVVVGFTWAAGPAASQAYANAGEGWQFTADAITPYLWVAAIGVGILTIGQIVFAATLGRSTDTGLAAPEPSDDFDVEFEGTPRYASWGRLIAGVAMVWLLAATLTAVLPIADPAVHDATLLADTSRTYPAGSSQLAGRDLYISEGCIECHTQQVRPVGTDVGLGPVSIAGDYANEDPALLGLRRFGPDLMHVASRGEFFDKVLMAAHLEDPRSLVPWSTMPSYSYLSDRDIADLVSYIETLR
jgi:cbb3-type cytochrome oxidase subunit 1/mono/diheme cytochrome c family protein